MYKKISVKNKSPLLVRLYNACLILFSKMNLVNHKVDKEYYLNQLEGNKQSGLNTNIVTIKALEKFINNVNQNNLNPATEIFIKNEIERILSNRKKINKFLQKHPKTVEIELSNPIFIVGLPRTGTTALQNMFSFLRECRVLKLWELHYPTAFMEGERAIKFAKKETEKHSFLQNFSKPEQKYIHPIGVNYPDECFRLLFNSFTSIAVSSALGLDDYENWVLESDMLATYNEYKKQLQILSIGKTKKQMVLKAPEHLWNLDVLLEVFPKARFVITHRNPASSIVSYASMISMFRRTAYNNPDFKRLGPYVATVFKKGLDRAISVRQKIDSNKRIIDVHCEDIQNLPIQTIEKICEFLNINTNEEDHKKIKEWLKNKNTDFPGRHYYEYEKYGVDKALIEKDFYYYNDQKYKST